MASIEQKKRDGKVFYQQYATNNPKSKLLNLYDDTIGSFIMVKTIAILNHELLEYKTYFHKRKAYFQKLKAIQNKKANPFSQKEKFTLHNNTENEPQKQVLIQIQQPYLKAISLKQFIRNKNVSCHNCLSIVQPLFYQLINLFIRIDSSSLFIPTFHNILINEQTLKCSLNVFSFAGLEVLTHKELIPTHSLKQILPFLQECHFNDQIIGVNLIKALAIIVLGLILGKQIDLQAALNLNTPFVKRQQVKTLVDQNKRQLGKILNSSSIKKIFANFKNMKIQQFLSVVWKKEDLSWSDVVSFFQKDSINYFLGMEEESQQDKNSKKPIAEQRADSKSAINDAKQQKQSKKSQYKIQFKQIIYKYASFKWNHLDQKEKEVLFRNHIINKKAKEESLTYEQAEILLIYSESIDFNLLKDCQGSLSALLYNYQNQKLSSFKTDTVNIMDKFNAIALQIVNSQQRLPSLPKPPIISKPQDDKNASTWDDQCYQIVPSFIASSISSSEQKKEEYHCQDQDFQKIEQSSFINQSLLKDNHQKAQFIDEKYYQQNSTIKNDLNGQETSDYENDCDQQQSISKLQKDYRQDFLCRDNIQLCQFQRKEIHLQNKDESEFILQSNPKQNIDLQKKTEEPQYLKNSKCPQNLEEAPHKGLKRKPLFRIHGEKGNQNNQLFLSNLQVWKEPLIHKFNFSGQIGTVMSERLACLHQYSKILTYSDQNHLK